MLGSLRIGALFFALLLATPIRTRAQDEPIAVWYRSAAGCPDGAAFLGALEQRAVRARLAQVGDAIDFVVTLGPSDAGMRGVLERQTDTGTVAIRTVDDISCAQVAEALSLTLALAAQDHERVPASTEASTPAPPPAPMQPAAPEPPPPPPAAAPPLEEPATVRWSLGLLGDVITGVAPGPMAGGQLFVELASTAESALRPALRLGAIASYGSGERQDRELSARVLGGRLELSPLELSAGMLAFRPSVAFELGQLHTEGGGETGAKDAGLWAAAELSARANLAIAEAFSLEAQLGLALPLTRYELRSEGDARVAHETAAASLAARIGAVVHFL